MNLNAFVRAREPDWRRLDERVSAARGRPERLGAAGVRELARLYRAAAADLAVARRRYPLDPVVGRLEALVARARATVYSTETRRGTVRDFVAHRYWRRVRERPRPLLAGIALLAVPSLLAGVWALADPSAALGVVPEQFRAAAEPSGAGARLAGDERAAFSSAIFANNLRVALLAFAGGITAGLLTAFVVAYNGLFLGAIVGIAAGAGRGPELIEYVIAHGLLELSCIAVAGASGLRVGWALVEPGPRRRGAALAEEARAAVEVVIGTAPWLALAGIVEGFVTGSVGLAGAIVVGVGLAALYWALVLVLGRPRPAAGDALPAA